MAKLTKSELKTLSRLIGQTMHFVSIIERRNNNCPNLPEWFTDKPVAYYEGMLAATYGTIESILHDRNAYRGYNEYRFVGKLGEDTTYHRYHGEQLSDLYQEALKEAGAVSKVL